MGGVRGGAFALDLASQEVGRPPQQFDARPALLLLEHPHHDPAEVTLKPWIFDFFEAQFERKWCSGTWAAGMPDECVGHLNPVGSIETTEFVPLAADKPINLSPASAVTNCSISAAIGLWLQAASWGLKAATRASAAMPMVVGAGLNSPK